MAYSVEVREQALELLRRGHSAVGVQAMLGLRSRTVVWHWVKIAGMESKIGAVGGVAGAATARGYLDENTDGEWVDANGRLTYAGRVLIEIRHRDGHTPAQIARELGVHRSTVGRELVRGRQRPGVPVQARCRPGTHRYAATRAHAAAVARRRRPRPTKLAQGSRLRLLVVCCLHRKFSPEQISGELARRFPHRDDYRVSHETIYQALYVQGKGSLRHELTVEKALRSGRTSRRPTSRLPARKARSWIGDQAHISHRPAEVADRAVPGHWEGDLIIGAGGSTALITLVERHTRYAMIRRLPFRHEAPTVAAMLIEMMSDLPPHLRRTLTWDQGSEMATHPVFTLATDCTVYFCDPHSPWQRGTNENTNGLIRDFYPKNTDFAQITDADIANTQRLLNLRPRKTLGWHRPTDKLTELLTVATTT